MPNQANPDHFGREERPLAPDSIPSQDINDLSNSPEAGNAKTWKLKVQGVIVEFDKPIILAREALVAAGFDPGKPWHIFLIVQGHEKDEITVDTQIDLRAPGLEKIRLMQRNVDNGDGQLPTLRRMFQLLDIDHQHLDRLGLRWESVLVEKRRWLLIHDYPLPAGYTPEKCTLALDVLEDYPASQIDMFYFAPWVSRTDGGVIPSIQVRATIDAVEYQGWSRHRNNSCPWDPSTDNVCTHLVLVDSCLAREVGQ